MKPLLLVTVGSDHHPFDRLVGWVDSWLAAGGADRVEAVVQHGTAAAPVHAEAHEFLPHDRLMDLTARASVLVTQGGPMGIVETRRHGLVPIAVPRIAVRGEVVDDHQVTFCRQLGAAGDLLLAESESALHAAIERVLAEPAAYRLPVGEESPVVAETLVRFGTMLDELAAHPRRRRRWFSLAG